MTLSEHFGIPADERIADTAWLEVAGFNGWAVFMKDRSIRRRRIERAAVERYDVRCFCLTRQDLTGAQMAERFLSNLDAITDACGEPGPFIYAVYETRVERLRLGSSPR